MRALAVDFGGRRIGIAVGESDMGIVSPRPNLEASGTLKKDAEAILVLAKKEEADAVVVGIPLIEGEETKMSRICRQLARHIEEQGMPVHQIDEAMTSVQAESHLFDGNLRASQRRKLRDGEAARLILERFFHETTKG
jgi:putative holliday junction resolvase